MTTEQLPARRRKTVYSEQVGEIAVHMLDDGTYKLVAPANYRIVTGSNFPDSPNHRTGPRGGYLEVEVVAGKGND
jgi:hypothetical protein